MHCYFDSIRGGDVAVLYDASVYDSCLDGVLTRKVIRRSRRGGGGSKKKDGSDSTSEAATAAAATDKVDLFIRVGDEEVPYNPGFTLYLVCRGAGGGVPEYELQTRCTLVDFNFTQVRNSYCIQGLPGLLYPRFTTPKITQYIDKSKNILLCCSEEGNGDMCI